MLPSLGGTHILVAVVGTGRGGQRGILGVVVFSPALGCSPVTRIPPLSAIELTESQVVGRDNTCLGFVLQLLASSELLQAIYYLFPGKGV